MKILLVDDDRATLNALQFGLIRFGFEVETAERGDHALELIRKIPEDAEPVSLLVTDFRMGRVNGLELIRAAKKTRGDLPCILMTGFGGRHVQNEVLSLDHCRYIEKPFSHESLLDLIGALMAAPGRPVAGSPVRKRRKSHVENPRTA